MAEPNANGLTPIKWRELARLVSETPVHRDFATITLTRGEMLWLLNAGLSEARRSGDHG